MIFHFLLTFFISFPLAAFSFDEQKVLNSLNARLGNSPAFAKLSTGDKLNAVLKTLESEELGEHENLNSPAGNEESAALISSNADLAFQCYDQTIGVEESANLFLINRREVVIKYFSFHTNHFEGASLTIFVKRIRGLLESISYIANRVINCIKEAKDGKVEPTRIGLTSMSAYSRGEYKNKILSSSVSLSPVSGGTFSSNLQTISNDNNETFKLGLCNMSFLFALEDNPPWNWDWRDRTIPSPAGNYSVVGPVKDQSTCGSCYIFGPVASMEAAYMLSEQNDRLNQTLFSEQVLLDCTPGSCGAEGEEGENGKKSLGGGRYPVTFAGAAVLGLTEAWRAPYLARRGDCPVNETQLPAVSRPTGACLLLPAVSDEELAAAAFRYGPPVVTFNADAAEFQHLRGPFNGLCPSDKPNHGVLLAGWTEEYWIIKNSWGREWGIEGYLYLKRTSGPGCGLYNSAGIPAFEGGLLTNEDILPFPPEPPTTTTTSTTTTTTTTRRYESLD